VRTDWVQELREDRYENYAMTAAKRGGGGHAAATAPGNALSISKREISSLVLMSLRVRGRRGGHGVSESSTNLRRLDDTLAGALWIPTKRTGLALNELLW
jgi:hypothetical protein